MKLIYNVKILIIYLILFSSCNSKPENTNQNKQSNLNEKKLLIGGGCDGCELMYNGMPSNIHSIDTSPGWYEKGQKLLITGTIFEIDGRTPAANIIVYYWQTDNNGYYSPIKGMDENTKRHGHIRGWVKSDENGKYSIYTIKPIPYPNENIPAHIHTSIKEPAIANEYYIDEFVFDDDKLLTSEKRKALENRGGSGILRVLLKDNLQIAEHNIILGLNIPNYPKKNNLEKQSGLQIGEDNPSFIPFHAFGPDKGTRTCPVCKYGRYHGIIYFVGNHPDWNEIKKWLIFFEQESIARNKYLKVYFVYGNENNYKKEIRQKELEKIGTELNLKNIALTFVPSMNDTVCEVNLNKINPNVENTIIIYRHRAIINKFIDLKPSLDNFKLVSNSIDKTKSDYFNLQEQKNE